MGVPIGGVTDTASPLVTGTLTATALVSQGIAASTGTSAAATFFGAFNLGFTGTFSGTVLVEKSFDGGLTWFSVATDATGTAASYVIAFTAQSLCLVLVEPEHQVAWRVRCSSYTSGTLTYRLSGGGGNVNTFGAI